MLENFCKDYTNECVSGARRRVSAQKMMMIHLAVASHVLVYGPCFPTGLIVN